MQTFTANLKHAARNRETLHIGGGIFTPEELQQVAAQLDQLREALYLALPFVEDHEGSPIYKPQAVAQAVARIRAALGETAPAKLRQAAPLMLDALQRITHPAADESDLENALQVIAQATGEPTP